MKPYSAQHVAEAIGVSVDTFYRTRQLRHERDKLPSPICEHGRLAWEPAGFDAWLTRHHPLRPKAAPANDLEAPIAPTSDDEARAALHNYYRQMAVQTR